MAEGDYTKEKSAEIAALRRVVEDTRRELAHDIDQVAILSREGRRTEAIVLREQVRTRALALADADDEVSRWESILSPRVAESRVPGSGGCQPRGES